MADPAYSYQAPSREVQDMLMGRVEPLASFRGSLVTSRINLRI